MRVFVAKALQEQLGSSAQVLVAHFKEWKGLQDPCDHFEFGRLTPEKMPPAHDFEAMWHVHLLPPVDTQKRADWLTKWNFSDPRFKRARCNRTSDRLLFFAEHKGDWLLVTIGDHAVFGNRQRLEKWAEVVDRWVAAMERK
jgi:hypothetical protein